MLNHIYIDNCGCFTNFEWKPGRLSLLLGQNGSGKTSIFEAVELVRTFVTEGSDTHDTFPAYTITAWDKRPMQTFEIGILGNGGQYRYRLEIEHDFKSGINGIASEEVSFDDKVLYRFENEKALLFNENGSAGPAFPAISTRSPISGFPSGEYTERLVWFRRRLQRMYFIYPVPSRMSAISENEMEYPDRNLVHYASWLRHLVNDLSFPAKLIDALAPIIDGLHNIEFKTFNQTTKLLNFMLDFAEESAKGKERRFSISLDRMSDGQRCLAALYTALLVMQDQECSVLWDEPDNYVSLREIQPWVDEIRRVVKKPGRQCLLISHHPELINALAAEHGTLIYRDSGGPARAKPFEWKQGEISPAEIVARGWEE